MDYWTKNFKMSVGETHTKLDKSNLSNLTQLYKNDALVFQ